MKRTIRLITFLFLVSLTVSIVAGCLFETKPVSLSPAYRAQVATSVQIITELERRAAAGTIDPNDFSEAMKVARNTLEEVLAAILAR